MDTYQDKFEAFISSKMQRFNYLLEKSQFQFNQYQYDGVKWCVSNELKPDKLRKNYADNGRGGFIADEMGLGKTIMMIGTLFVNYLPHTLIVVPPILIQQWFEEISRASGHKALLFYGYNKKIATHDELYRSPIVLTTYNTLLAKNCPLKKIGWSRVVFDEAHHLRNSSTRRFQACKEIKANIRWLITGTPIQNRKKDFYSLCEAVGMKSTFYKDPKNLPIIGKWFVLRRTKIQVGINLPEVNKNDCVVKWANKQELRLSEELHALLPNQTNVYSKKMTLKGIVSLVAMIRAKQACIMPNLMRNTIHKMGILEPEALEVLNYTSKLDAVIKLMLERKDNGKGKIVFCHYQGEIDAIAERLLKGGMTKVITYDGRNSGGKHLAELANPADALVIQIQSGCEGLNLQNNFSEIYFVSPHWNPSVEDQAIARCHRIGQTKSVDVFKFEMSGFSKQEGESKLDPISLEKYVNKMQQAKRELSKEILTSITPNW